MVVKRVILLPRPFGKDCLYSEGDELCEGSGQGVVTGCPFYRPKQLVGRPEEVKRLWAEVGGDTKRRYPGEELLGACVAEVV